ncbi:hypothetical protein CLF_101928 [Clonorchis sinensis]|uniref:Uncharacterized protein n=1 Tax=Clonorchis sinensis TaxID=79923 RepID=G7Y6W3_CLOSI|nr:hypothetical protein CLF_101928 [Clonorchis sinensis]
MFKRVGVQLPGSLHEPQIIRHVMLMRICSRLKAVHTDFAHQDTRGYCDNYAFATAIRLDFDCTRNTECTRSVSFVNSWIPVSTSVIQPFSGYTDILAVPTLPDPNRKSGGMYATDTGHSPFLATSPVKHRKRHEDHILEELEVRDIARLPKPRQEPSRRRGWVPTIDLPVANSCTPSDASTACDIGAQQPEDVSDHPSAEAIAQANIIIILVFSLKNRSHAVQ